MTNVAATIAPKSDQLNADDLIGGPRNITIKEVRGADDPQQPISIFFEGDNGKPYKPCLSMRRLLVAVWGGDGNVYVGRTMTLYSDPDVVFGGQKVGGIRISHVSHINKPETVLLTTTRSKRRPYQVKPLEVSIPTTPADSSELKEDATNAASCGMEIYKNWFEQLTPTEKTTLVNSGHHETCKTAAAAADKESEG